MSACTLATAHALLQSSNALLQACVLGWEGIGGFALKFESAPPPEVRIGTCTYSHTHRHMS